MLVKTSTLHYHIVQVLLTCGSCKERNILKKNFRIRKKYTSPKNVAGLRKLAKCQFLFPHLLLIQDLNNKEITTKKLVYKLDRWTFKWKKMLDNLSLKKNRQKFGIFSIEKNIQTKLSSKKSNNLITLCNTSCSTDCFHFEFLIHLIFLK